MKLNDPQKKNGKRQEDKLKQHEHYGNIKTLFDPLKSIK